MPSTTPSTPHVKRKRPSFETAFEVSKAVARSGVVPSTREFLMATDTGVVVTTGKGSDSVTDPILSISKYDKDAGGHMATIGSTTAKLCDCSPVNPIPLFLDAVLPCGEIVELHHCPTSVRDISLSFLYTNRKDLKSKQKMMRAWGLSDVATQLAMAERKELRRRWDASGCSSPSLGSGIEKVGTWEVGT